MKQFILLFALFAAGLFLTADARAATRTVTKTADTNDGVCDADCSLREALAAAAVSGDAIVFSELFNSAQTITLAGADLVVNKNLTISGPGPELLTISGNNVTRVFRVMNSFNVVLSGLTVTKGSASSFNGQFDGGGIFNDGDLTIERCVIKSNAASDEGAGIYHSGGTLNVTDSIISRNFLINGSGGGIYSAYGAVTVTNSSVSENFSNVGAGGIKGGLSVTVTNSSINNNSGRHAGGILCGQLTLINSTVSGNGSDQAGGINCVEVNITNSTISGNRVSELSPGGAGGVHAQGSLIVTNSTITNNFAPPGASSAGGIFRSSGPVTIRGSIVAANVDNANVPDIGGVSTDFYTSAGYNLIGNVGTITGFNQPGDQTGTSAQPLDPMLDPLGNYGGTTATHRLQAGSPAIDRGNAFGRLTDQRGFARTFDFPDIPNAPLAGFTRNFKNTETIFALVGDGTDIGAYERSLAGVEGRVMTSSGRGVPNARVILTDSGGNTRTALSGNFGYYRFGEVLLGETYTVVVVSKSYQFAPRVFALGNQIDDLNFIAEEKSLKSAARF
jgi:CSLREA domain-containing protein